MLDFKKIKIILIFFSFSILNAIPYSVEFIGLKETKIIDTIKNSSDLFLLMDRPPKTINGLRYRIQSNLPEIIKVFHAFGYYDASLSYDLEEEENKAKVYLFCDSGPRYLLHNFEIRYTPCDLEKEIKPLIDLQKLEIKLDAPTNSQILSDAKNRIILALAVHGYPLASIQTYDVIVDGIRKTINVNVCINLGPICYFGPTSILGLKDIDPRYIYRKIAWMEKDPYSPHKIIETQSRLTETNLFSSVSINHADNLNEENTLPMKIQVIESKHQNINVGTNYATVDGFGVTFSYINYNMRRMGEILAFQAELAKKAYTGFLTYKKPDFLWYNQDLFFSFYALKEKVWAYHAYTYGVLSKIAQRINKYFQYSYGIKSEFVEVTHSANRGRYQLLGAPFFLKYDTSNHLLNPTKGFAFSYSMTPFTSVALKKSTFLKQKFSYEVYVPFNKDEKIVFALRMQLGSIFGPSVYHIPITKLFLGGSDDNLRGYRYKTVGPRNSNHDLIGGRSAIYLSFEPRLRVTTTIGIVPFFDIGNVQLNQLPTFEGRWRKSVGIGLRYFTFFGPLRLDVGFPLDRVHGDPHYRIYVSIGQTF